MRTAPILICLLLLAGCISRAERAMQKSPDFQAGYSDGCSSASLQGADPHQSAYTRDDNAYQVVVAYRRGWNEGFGACRQMAMPQNAGVMGPPLTP